MADAEKKMVQELIERKEAIKELALMAQKQLIINTLLKLEIEVTTSKDDTSVVKLAKSDALEEAIKRIKELGDEADGSDKQDKIENVC